MDAGKIVYQFIYHTSEPMVFQHQTSARTSSYQYYTSAPQPIVYQQLWFTVQQPQPVVQQPQPIAYQQPWLTVQQPQPVVQQPQSMVYQLQQPASYQLQMLASSLMICQLQQSGGYQPQASAYQPMSYQPSMAIPQQSNYYLPQMLVCHTTCQLQQLSVQQLIAESPTVRHPIMQQFQPYSCQPSMQRSEPIIHQQYIANSQDGDFESEVLDSGVSRKVEDDNIEDKISANIEDEEATSELLIYRKSEELKSIDSGVQLLAKGTRKTRPA